MYYPHTQNRQNDSFRLRLLVAAALVIFCFGLLGVRFAWLQILKHQDYITQADNNRIAVTPVVPDRGMIKDKNGIVLAHNYSAFTLEITPSKLTQPLESMMAELEKIIPITAQEKKRFKRLREDAKNFSSIPLKTQLTDEEMAKIVAQKYRLDGVDVKARLFRRYPFGESSAHLLGYLGRISTRDKERIDEVSLENDQANTFNPRKSASNYEGTDHIGKLGIEQSYEYTLHGVTGAQRVEVNSSGRPVRSLSTQEAVPGDHIILSVDVVLQQLIEKLYAGRKGALVALDPNNGAVLAFVSQPNFDPNAFTDGIDTETWRQLNEDPQKPLLNRALRGTYPPGSTYKPFMALAGLTLGKRTAEQTISDPGYFMFGNHRFRDDKAGGHGAVNMYKSIVESCDTYYYLLANELGVDTMHDFMKSFYFGQITGIDLEGETKGILPSKAWKIRTYKTPAQQKWYDGETISLGIGQGYNSFTMLQLAQAMAMLANGGKVYKPHVLAAIENHMQKKRYNYQAKPEKILPLKPEHLEVIKKALIGVNITGTGASAFQGSQYQAAGKTGTAQVFTVDQNERYNSKALSKDLHDHALYAVFAPADQPKIALAVIVENGGFGAQAAAPIARAVLDYYLTHTLPPGFTPNLPQELAPTPIHAGVAVQPKLDDQAIFQTLAKSLGVKK